ncbi:MAG TPA: dihydrofolate reductase family protein [Thermoplasmata archaeon]|nr:dihydrofolate reductase family protein [Thermoplasmata archaeon]
MRRVSLQMYLTLDGYNEFPTYPGSEPPANEPDLIAEEMWIKRWDSIDALLFDQQTYGEWAEFWPLSNRTAEEHPWFRQMSEFAERVEKVVMSASPRPTNWVGTRFVPGELGEALSKLKQSPGGTMAVVAPRLGMELIRRGLIDDYFLAVSPVVLGKGKRFFEEMEHQQTLHLVEVKSFKSGELVLHYEAVP